MKVDKTVTSIWQSFIEGDESAFTSLYHQHAERLLTYGYKFNLKREIVQDVLQEVFTDLYLKRKKLDAKVENPAGYLFVSMKNSLLKKIQKEKKINYTSINGSKNNIEFSTEYNFQDKWIQSEISEETTKRISIAINALSSKQKEIIFLKFEEELEYVEIARILNISIDSARKQLYRALKSLRELLDYKDFKFFILFIVKKRFKKPSMYFKKRDHLVK
ncbi:MAG: hypothetical protein COC06_08025 [Bacteroidales bacterium]|nr:MAG: hypothetical protein COC06_08025 [Bacteroidales bacterium]